MKTVSVSCLPEWHAVKTLWVGWPHLREEWAEDFEPACAEILAVIQRLQSHAHIRVACGTDESVDHFVAMAEGHLNAVEPMRVPMGDIWLRDTGPITSITGGEPVANQFQFNGWGGKYILSGDTETSSAIADAEGLRGAEHPFILEGGSIEIDGAGRLITTRECLLNPNRNKDWTEQEAERALAETLGADTIIWLDHGLKNDHTDGHVDNLARFIGPGHVVCQSPVPNDPNADRLIEIEDTLRQSGLRVSTIPSPGMIEDADGTAMPASHMNFVIVNGLVLVPTYESQNSTAAVAALQELLPNYTIAALPANAVLTGGGSFHCMSCHIPQV